MAGKALCLPQTIGSTTGGLVLYCACAMDRQPACMLFANPIDSLAAAGAILADVWLQPRAKCRSSTRWARNSCPMSRTA